MKTQLRKASIFNAVSSFNLFWNTKVLWKTPKFNGVYSRNNSPKIKNGANVKNRDEFNSIGTHWIDLYVNGNNIIYFDGFWVEHIPKKKKKKKKKKKIIGSKNVTNIYRIQAYDLIMCGYFFNGFVDFMLRGKSLLNYTNLFSPNECEKNDKIIIKYFQ